MAFRDFFANMFNRNAPAEPSAIEPAQDLGSFANLSADGRFINGTMHQDQYAEYLEKEAAGELTRYSINTNDQPIVSTSASNIHEVSTMGQNADDFWRYKEINTGHSKDDYLEMASHIPAVQERINAGESLSSLEKDPVVGECAKNYFDPANMPIVSQYGDTFIAGDGNRHRIVAAQELGYDIPVRVGNVYEPNGQVQTAGSHAPQSDYGTAGNPYPNNTGINVSPQDKLQGLGENTSRSQNAAEPYRAGATAGDAGRNQAAAEPYRATRSSGQAEDAPYRATRHTEPEAERNENALGAGTEEPEQFKENEAGQETASGEDAAQEQGQENAQNENQGQEQPEGEEQPQDEEQAVGQDKAESQDEAEGQDETESQDETEGEDETESQDEAEGEDETESQDEAEGQDETESQDEAVGQDKAESQDEAEGQDETESQDEAEGEGETEGQDETEGEDETQGEEQAENQDNTEDQSQDESQDQGQDEAQDQGQDEAQDQGQDKSQDQEQAEDQGESQDNDYDYGYGY